jgi:hypothetical protein
VTREHIYRRAWVSALVPHATSFTNSRAEGRGEALPVSEWTTPTADVVVRAICAHCNNTWINQLDMATEPLVTALCKGEAGVRIEDGALVSFASWAVKTAMLMDCLGGPPSVRQSDRQRLLAERVPPPGFRVFVATMESYTDEIRTTPTTLEAARELGSLPQAFVATFRVLHLVVQVVCPLYDDVHPQHDEFGARHSELVWPRTQPISWPLPETSWLKSDADLLLLTRSFRTGGTVRARTTYTI